MNELLGKIAWKGFMLAFGFTSLVGVYTTAVLQNGALWARDTKQEKNELAEAQERCWNLMSEPLHGFRHAFHATNNGTNLHYVTNSTPEAARMKNVIIFIHGTYKTSTPMTPKTTSVNPETGFPDSFLLWKHLLQSPELSRDNVLLAVDLPGYGGSDSLPTYGPNDVLEALSEYIIGMRKLFLQDGKKVVVVTHDWGTIIGSRLAAEAPGLADHYVLTSAVLVCLVMPRAFCLALTLDSPKSCARMLSMPGLLPLRCYIPGFASQPTHACSAML